MKIKHSLQIILLLLTIIPIICFGCYMIEHNTNHIENIMSENLQVVSDTQITDIRNFCKQRGDSLSMICQLDMVIDLILDRDNVFDGNRKYLSNFLETRVKNNEFSESLTIVDKDFNIIACSQKNYEKKAVELENSYDDFRDGSLFFSNILNPDSHGNTKQVVVVVKGIFYKEKLIGYIVEEINLLFFEQIRMEAGLWKDGTLYLTDGNNKIITAGEKNEESRREYVSSEEERKEFSEQWKKVDFSKNPEGEIQYHVNGVEYITYYACIDYTDWKILITVNLSNALKQKDQFRLLSVISIIIMIVIMLCMNKFVSIRITTPINRINQTLHRIKESGDYSLRIEGEGTNEIAELSREINDMIGYIEEEKIYEKEQKRKLKYKAERDSLTKAYNKEIIEKRIKSMLEACKLEHQAFSMVFVDVDNFKQFNTNYGHMVGDQVLQFVTETLERETQGTIGRVGGDEFVVGIDNPNVIKNLKKIFSRIVEILNKEFVTQTSQQVPIPCSMGIVITKNGGVSYDDLILKADEAMFQTKENGKNGFFILRI